MFKKIKVEDFLLMLSLLFQDAGFFKVLPLNLYQIIIIILGLYLVFLDLKDNKKIDFPIKIILLLLYISFITFINIFDFESIKSVGYFSIELYTFYLYLRRSKDFDRLFRVIYVVAIVLSIIQVIQFFGYHFGIPPLYDYTIFGFSHNGHVIPNNSIFRCYSLYSEPSHLAAILSAGFYICLKNKRIKSSLLIVVASILTISVIVYLGILSVFLLYCITNYKSNKKNIIILLVIVFAFSLLLMTNNNVSNVIGSKLSSISSASSTSTSDSTTFAIKSNYMIAIEKIKDGYILGTGMDSHRFYYFKYIDHLYSDVLRYLNYTEASSLYIRIISEFGIIGFVFICYLIIDRFIIAIKGKNHELLFILLLFIISTIRNGHYTTITSLIFFIILLMFDELFKRKEKKVNIKILYETSLFKTIRFNLHYFGILSIFKPKVIISKKTKLLEINGKIVIDNGVRRIKIGYGNVGIFDNKYERTVIQNNGTIHFKGNAVIGSGSRIVNNGLLIFGDNFNISARSNIICYKKIKFGSDVLISWNCLIMDTDFHKIISLSDDKIINENKEINVGNHVWICTNVCILKGSIIPSNTVISANSIITKELLKKNTVYSNNNIIKEKIDWSH